MAKHQQIYADRVLTGAEKKRRFDDKATSIDAKMDEMFAGIDWERRREAESDIVKWVKTYCMGVFLEDVPSKYGEDVLRRMWSALDSHNNFMICMGRGSGKSCFELCTTMAALAQGKQKFIVIISNNSRAAGSLLKDMWRMISEKYTAFAQDYPEVCGPYLIADGAWRRRQQYRGHSTELQKNATDISFPRLFRDDNTEYPTSGAVVSCRGVGSGIRGLRKGTQRVTCVLLDDLQDFDSASNPTQVEKLMDIIRKDIVPLAGKERLSIIQTATPILPDDLVDKIKNDKSWQTSTYPAIINYPTNIDKWHQYFELFDEENACGKKHVESLKFYEEHFDEMNEGAEVFNPTRFSKKDGHLSMIQKLLELKHDIGEAAFSAEYQMKPMKTTFSIDITPKDIIARVGQSKHFEVPDGCQFVAASTDLNLSKYLTTTIVAFKRDMTAYVLHHDFTRCNIDFKLPEAERNRQIWEVLDDYAKKLKDFGVKIDGWGIDASGWPFDVCCEFAKHSSRNYGIPCCAMCGRASHVWNGFVRSRLRDAINRTVLCGDSQEQLKPGAGKKYMFWDSDHYRATVQKAFLAPPNAMGGIQVFDGPAKIHTDFAIQVCAEKLLYVDHKQDGKDYYTWKSIGDHDCLDSLAQAYAVAASQGLSGNVHHEKAHAVMRQKPVRRRYRII